ncbi:putative RlpA-like domain superfamily, kiwellin [Dioscorea sansibarensis]
MAAMFQHRLLLTLVMLFTMVSNFISTLHACSPSGHLRDRTGNCNTVHDSDCCKSGEEYPQSKRSPPVTNNTRATMTINIFSPGQDGGGPLECDNCYHSDSELVVALSTGWYDNGSRCHKNIRINANGKSVLAKVVDECDSVNGCDEDHDFQPPYSNRFKYLNGPSII